MKLGTKRFNVDIVFIALIIAFCILDSVEYTAIVLGCAALHEAAHLFAGQRYSLKLKAIKGRPFGVSIEYDDLDRLSYRQEIVLALAGPAANIAVAAAVFLYMALFGLFVEGPFIVTANLCLAAVNLLPVRGLDGGRALCCALLLKYDLATAEKICRIIETAALMALTAVSVALLIASGFNISLCLIALFAAFRIRLS